MANLTQTPAQVQADLDAVEASKVGLASISDSADTRSTAVKKSGFHSLEANSANAPNTERAVLISAVRDTAASGEIRYGQIAITESGKLYWAEDVNGTLGVWNEGVSIAEVQTLTNKTFTSPDINGGTLDNSVIGGDTPAAATVTELTSGGDILSDTDSTDSIGSTAVRWLKGWFDTLTAGTLTIGPGSIVDSSGAIDFDNENLSTTGTLTTGATSVLISTDERSDPGPDLKLYRNSASPADADFIGRVFFNGNGSTGSVTTYAALEVQIDDATNGTEDGTLLLKVMENGTLTTKVDMSAAGVVLAGGLQVAGLTTGSLNASGNTSITTLVASNALTVNQDGAADASLTLDVGNASYGAQTYYQAAGVNKFAFGMNSSGNFRLYNYTTSTTDFSIAGATGAVTVSALDAGATSITGTLDVSDVLSLDAVGITGGKLAVLGDLGVSTVGLERGSAALLLGYGVSPSTTAAGEFISSYGPALSRSGIMLGGNSIELWAAGSTTTAVGSAVTMTKAVTVTTAGAQVHGTLAASGNQTFTGANPVIAGADADGYLTLTSNTTALGCLINMYGNTHATNANDLVMNGGGALQLHYDHSASNFDFQGNSAAFGGNLTANAFLNIGSHDTLTIATGAITAVKSFQTVDTESAAAADDLITINGGATGNILVLRQASEARDVTVKHNSGGGNIRLAGGADFNISTTLATITLAWIASVWVEISRSANT